MKKEVREHPATVYIVAETKKEDKLLVWLRDMLMNGEDSYNTGFGFPIVLKYTTSI